MSQVNVNPEPAPSASPEAIRRRNLIIALSTVAGVLLIGPPAILLTQQDTQSAEVNVDVQRATATARAARPPRARGAHAGGPYGGGPHHRGGPYRPGRPRPPLPTAVASPTATGQGRRRWCPLPWCPPR